MFSYHDVAVVANNCVYKLSDLPFSTQLTCDRVSGWALTVRPQQTIHDKTEVVAEEFGDTPFVLYVKTTRMCHSRWAHYVGATVQGEDTLRIADETATVKVIELKGEIRIEVEASEQATTWLREAISLDGSIFWSRHEWDVQEVKEISEQRTELVVGIPRADTPVSGRQDHDGKTD